MTNIQSPKSINLALQGGGSHGAYTWGVLDRLLEEDGRLNIEGISGASAGAMNGAALLQGFNSVHGAEHARKTLDQFWKGVGALGSYELPQHNMLANMLGAWNVDNNQFSAMADAFQRMFSPAQTNPFDFNPLRDLAKKLFDVNAIRSCDRIKFFVSATNVETGRVRIFSRDEITLDVLMASACLPFTFRAVEIDGKPYWDGGYVGNPSLFPLIENCTSPDVLIVQINPMVREGVPSSSTEIINRLNEITFNSSLISEMRSIAFEQKLIDDDHLKSVAATGLKRMNIHVVSAESELRQLGASSKMNVNMDFLLRLKSIGRASADAWLTQHWATIGEGSSVDVRAMFL